MKSIKLKKKHKAKLLEMCEKLFSELGSVQLGVKEGHGWSNDFLVFGIEKPDSQTFVIHWFEFCMTHLSKKILKNNYFKIGAFNNIILFQNNNPIDYLHEEFKKLKL